MTRWWIHRRARAMSVAFSFISLGGAVFAPLGDWLISTGGVSRAATVLGVLVIVIALPPILGVLVWDPAEMGLEPDDGWTPTRPRRSGIIGDQYRTWSRSAAARTVPFWAVLFGFTIVLFCQVGFLAHEVAFLTDRYDSGTGARAIAVSAIGSAIARLIVGTFADAVDKRLLTMVLVLLQGATVAGFVMFDALAVNYLLALVFGFTMGNIFMFQALLVGEIFGIASFGSIFGLTSAVSQIAGGGGPVFIGWLESTSGSYSLPFMVTAVLTALASFVIAQARPLVGAAGAQPAERPVPVRPTTAPASLPD